MRRGFVHKAAGVLLWWLLSPQMTAQAADRLFVEAGSVDVNFGLAAEVGAEFDWEWSYPLQGGVIKGAWSVTLPAAYWRDAGQNDLMYGVGLAPLLRWEMAAPYVIEAGAGVYLLGNRPVKRLSTTMEFAEIVGLYYRYSSDLWLGYRFKHLSNGGMKKPNGGINFHLLHIKFAF